MIANILGRQSRSLSRSTASDVGTNRCSTAGPSVCPYLYEEVTAPQAIQAGARSSLCATFGLPNVADVRVTQLLATGLRRCECFLGPLCDSVTLFLGHGCVDVQHQRIHIRTHLCHDERRPLHHQAADEIYVAA